MYIRNSIKYKENWDEDFDMLRHRIFHFKKLAATVSANIHTAGNNLIRQNKQIMEFLKQNSELEKMLEKNVL